MRAAPERRGRHARRVDADAAILAACGAEPRLRSLACRVEEGSAPPDSHRGRRVDDGGERQRDVFEHDARLKVAGSRRGGPVYAAYVVAGNVRAQFDELVAVAAIDGRRSGAEVARAAARAQKRL